MKKLFAVLVVLALVVFGGKLYIENRYEKQLDNLIAMASGYAAISYDRVELEWDGALSLHRLEVTPPNIDESFSAKQIRLSSSDRFAAIKGEKTFENGRFPDSFSIEVVRVEYSSKLAERFSKKDHCRRFESTFVYSQVGIDRVQADMTLTFDFSDPYNAELDSYYADDVGTMDIRWVFNADAVTDLQRLGTRPPLREISVNAELNQDVASSIADYCGGVFGISAEDYLQKVVGSPKYSVNSFGADLGPEVRQALINFMRGGYQVSLSSQPSEQLLNFDNAKFFKAKDVVRWLNLSITAGGVSVPVSVAEEIAEEQETEKESAVDRGKYTAIRVSQARQYIDRNVRIYRTNDRKPIKGRLLGIEDNVLAVEVFRLTGMLTFKVPMADIAKLEVYL